jgi:hypothetical protein
MARGEENDTLYFDGNAMYWTVVLARIDGERRSKDGEIERDIDRVSW